MNILSKGDTKRLLGILYAIHSLKHFLIMLSTYTPYLNDVTLYPLYLILENT